MNLFNGLEKHSFRVVLADPPWAYDVRSPKGEGRSAKCHYDTMSLRDVAALPVGDYAELDSWLFLWITGPVLARGSHIPIMKAWGFEPSALAFCWVKTNPRADLEHMSAAKSFHVGMGFTTRHNVELVMLGRRGNVWRRSRAVRELIIAPVREHSRKPDEIYSRIEQFTWGPRLELFSRESRPGWVCRGDEAGKFDHENNSENSKTIS